MQRVCNRRLISVIRKWKKVENDMMMCRTKWKQNVQCRWNDCTDPTHRRFYLKQIIFIWVTYESFKKSFHMELWKSYIFEVKQIFVHNWNYYHFMLVHISNTHWLNHNVCKSNNIYTIYAKLIRIWSNSTSKRHLCGRNLLVRIKRSVPPRECGTTYQTPRDEQPRSIFLVRFLIFKSLRLKHVF